MVRVPAGGFRGSPGSPTRSFTCRTSALADVPFKGIRRGSLVPAATRRYTGDPMRDQGGLTVEEEWKLDDLASDVSHDLVRDGHALGHRNGHIETLDQGIQLWIQVATVVIPNPAVFRQPGLGAVEV